MALTQISTGGIKDDAVTDAKLPANSVGNSEMKDDAVGVAELSATGTPSSSTFLRGDNSWVTPTDTNTQLAFANDGNNRVVTGDGSGGLNGEANLTFDGTTLKITDTELAEASDNFSINIQSGNNDFYVKSGGTTIAAFKGQNKHLEITDGNLVIATAGHGIDFSATSDATGKTSELLSDYEEGTATMQLDGQGGSSPATQCDSNACYYTKIGRQVTVRVHWDAKNLSGIGGQIALRNLPFTVANTGGHFIIDVSMLYNVAWSGDEKHCFYTSSNTTSAYGLSSRDNTSWVNWAASDWDNSTAISLYLTFTYFTD